MNDALTGPLIVLEHICKSYNMGRPNEAEVLHDVSVTIAHGEFVALIGPSGSGKSTLLNIIGLLEKATTGTYQIAGQEVSKLTDAQLTEQRRINLGFVFQFHHLLPAFTALENVTLPALMREGAVSAKQLASAKAVLSEVGLESAMGKKPGELSGGMQQRVAIARALVLNPPLVLADEPTGNLDRAASDEVFELLRKMHAELKISFLIVTHDPALAERCDRIIELVDGRVVRDEATKNPKKVEIPAEKTT
jgi:lipoprotein-releasing system ATP-binding protein